MNLDECYSEFPLLQTCPFGAATDGYIGKDAGCALVPLGQLPDEFFDIRFFDDVDRASAKSCSGQPGTQAAW